MQLLYPFLDINPFSHGAHTLLERENVPSGQMLHLVEPSSEIYPEGQWIHLSCLSVE